MSFQAYIDNIQSKTGKIPEDFKKEIEAEGLVLLDLSATDLKYWLKIKYDLGHGHSMAIWTYFKSKNWVLNPKK
jgi:hypothetical protein